MQEPPKPLELRSKATPFKLPVIGEPGGSIALEELRGKGLLVNFWATWCAPCLKEMPLLRALHRRYNGVYFQIVSVTDDERGKVDAWLAENPLPFAVLHDARSELRASLKAEVLPFSVYIGPDGRVAGAVAGVLNAQQTTEAIERLIIAARAHQRAGAE